VLVLVNLLAGTARHASTTSASASS
jgi:hypothetical protein